MEQRAHKNVQALMAAIHRRHHQQLRMRALSVVIQEAKIMNLRSILTMTAVGLIGFCASSTARADEVVKFRMFLHATSVQNQEIGDVDGHMLYLGRFSGLAAFSDGSICPGTLIFTADYVKGTGTFSAYVSVTPSKDSTLWIKAAGTGNPEGATVVFPETPATVVGGSGRFEGAKGEGKFLRGVRLAPVPKEGVGLWNEFEVNLHK